MFSIKWEQLSFSSCINLLLQWNCLHGVKEMKLLPDDCFLHFSFKIYPDISNTMLNQTLCQACVCVNFEFLFFSFESFNRFSSQAQILFQPLFNLNYLKNTGKHLINWGFTNQVLRFEAFIELGGYHCSMSEKCVSVSSIRYSI